jgi:uncharacterized membrane protein YhhN
MPQNDMTDDMTPPKLNTLWLGVWFAFALTYILTMSMQPYALHYVIKAVPIWMLAVLCWQQLDGSAQKIMTVAMIFSSGGDVLLSLPLSYSFPAGLSSFLVAQLLYIFLLSRRRGGFQQGELGRSRLWLLALIGLYYVMMLVVLIPKTGELAVPVTVYMTAICSMGLFAALYKGSQWVLLGALCFMVSDSVIAINKFLVPFDLSGVVIMNTYYLAQLMIAVGIIHTQFNVKQSDQADV